MSKQEILEKAIALAIEGGWKDFRWQRVLRDNNFIDVPINQIIFNHDFAKALWGDARDHIGWGYKHNIGTPDEDIFNIEMTAPTWKLRLAQMAIADDPIEFLGNNI